MTSTAAAEGSLPAVVGLAFLGFPLHPPGRPGVTRAEHLSRVLLPMLFLQGSRDDFADPTLIRGVVDGLGARAALHVVEGGDHSFAVPKRSGRTAGAVLAELADAIVIWAAGLA
jgi:predicted alpha/beta-hydrolase family hydrolase